MERLKPVKISSDYLAEHSVFFTSDLHFGHKNIIEFCKRPFNSVEEMDEALIENWNSVVKPNDLVFNLGDFAFAPHWRWHELLARLNGNHILILGNHDISRWPGDKVMELFYRVEQQMILKVEEQYIYLNHYPFLCYGGTYRPAGYTVWQLHGHVHSSPLDTDKRGKDNKRLSLRFPYQYDVGVDNNNFTPVSWNQIKEIINNQIESEK